MAHAPDEEADVALTKKLIFRPAGIELARFASAETAKGPTPDFKLVRNGTLLGYCELKSPRDDWLDEQLAAAEPGQIVGGARPDAAYNNIARQVQGAARQFDAINPDHGLPNNLVIANHARQRDWVDLRMVLTGMWRSADGTEFPWLPHIAEGIIGEAKRRIDLFVWIDVRTGNKNYLCAPETPHAAGACKILGWKYSG
jgi:hypothetical protein